MKKIYLYVEIYKSKTSFYLSVIMHNDCVQPAALLLEENFSSESQPKDPDGPGPGRSRYREDLVKISGGLHTGKDPFFGQFKISRLG